MADIAALNLEVRSDSVKQATAELKAMAPAASAAERAAQRWGVATSSAARSTEDFSKRVQRTIRDLEFERQQLTRSAAEKERYAMLRRAGVAEASAEGRAILASVSALQAQRAANEASARAQQRTVLLANSNISAHDGFAASVGRLGAILAGAMGARAVLEAADAYTRFTNQLKVAGVAAGSMDEVQRALFASAQKNGVEIEALGKLYSRASMASGELGADQTKLLEFTDGVTAALRLQGGSSESASGALLQLSQALGSGIVRTEEFNSVLEGAYPIAQAAARGIDGMGGSVAKLRMAIADGQVTSRQFFDGLLKGFGETRTAAESMALTVGQASTNLETSWIKLIGQADKLLGISPTIAKGLGVIGDIMERLAANTERANRALASLPKDATFLEKLDAIFGGRYGNNAMGGLKLANEAEMTAFKLGEAQKRLADLEAQRPNASGMAARTLEDQIGRQRAIVDTLDRQRILSSQAGSQESDAAARLITLPPVEVSAPRGGGGVDIKPKGSDPYAKTIESAKEYILTKRAETEAIGQTVLAAARLKHEQELLNKAQNDGKLLSDAQKSALKDLAGQMAEADNTLATAKFIDDAKTKSQEFLEQQQLERDSLFLSTQAADALRLSTEMLNAAKRQGIELSPAEVEAIKASADAMAASKAKTDELKEVVGLGREVFKGFFSDIREGLMNGQTLWQSFGNAAVNALNRIAEKLIEMAATQLFEAAFPGGSGGGGGGGGIGGMIMNLFGGGGAGGFSAPAFGGGGFDFSGVGMAFAKGAAFRAGNVIPFARGDVFSSPTFFPMSRGRTGVLGEAGEEAIMPLRRGRNGRLGVEASGGRGGAGQVVVMVTGDTDLVRVTARDEAGRAVAVATPGIVKESVKKSGEQVPAVMARHEAQRGGEWRD